MKYVALIRGIMPGNPNMKSVKLKEFFESLEFKNVKTVIASGNVVFESKLSSTHNLEALIETELPKRLGFSKTTIVRSEEELKKFIDTDPFKGIRDEKPNYLVVTFFKDRKPEMATVLNLSNTNTPDFMEELEKKYGKDITTRTWKTLNRILNTMGSST